MKLLDANLKQTTINNDVGIKTEHVFDSETINAINAAIAIKRPLLVWGEPGMGKSQLAKAVAKELQRVFIPFVADNHTESHDLLWSFDAVARLAEAQIQPADNPNRQALQMQNYIVPQALWWGLNWENAASRVDVSTKQETAYRCQYPSYDKKICSPDNGVVVLIDEIDKADSDVPNGLLEALGANRFHPQGIDDAIEAKGEHPLVIITTNDERNLPDAFIRRCLSLHLRFPEGADAQREFLTQRGEVNFPELARVKVSDDNQSDISLLEQAANMLIEDRQHAEANHLYPLCGQAEYFDLLRGIKVLHQEKRGSYEELIDMLRPYTYQKNPQHTANMKAQKA